MDTYDEFLQALSLDPEGLSKQFMSFSAFFNILAAAVMGFLVLAIYLSSSERAKRDRNLYMVIPVLCVLMAVMMRVSGPQALAFFGIFGILSVIRFRSDITDQKGITFILFAVIEGVIIGVNAYLLALLAWLVVSVSILTGRYFFSHRVGYRLVLRHGDGAQGPSRGEVEAWFKARGVPASRVGFGMSSELSRGGSWESSVKAEYLAFPRREEMLVELMPAFIEEMKVRRVEVDFKRYEPS